MSSKIKMPPKISKLILAVTQEAERLGLPLYLVGGAVRDFILNRETSDIDFAVEGDPKPLADFCASLMGQVSVPFDHFGTLRLGGSGKLNVDFATTRKEEYPEPAALPVVSKPVSIEEDLKRRDFTINAMAWRLKSFKEPDLIDPFGGANDIDARRIKILHDQSFRDDPTRVFRATRYAARFSFGFDPDIPRLAQAALKAGYPQKLSRHRLAAEFLKILSEKNAEKILETLKEWGYLSLVFPRLSEISIPRFKTQNAEIRLGLLAFLLGKSGEEFISSLPIDRRLSSAISLALKMVAEKSSPRGDFPDISREIIRLACPDLPLSALRPIKIGGEDLELLGVSPGPEMGNWLKKISALQWAGKIKSRAEAISWIKREIGK